MITNLFFKEYDLISFGPYPPSSIYFNYNENDTILLEKSDIAKCEKILQMELRSGKVIENHPLYRYLSLYEISNGVVFNLGHTNFKEYLLTNFGHPKWSSTSFKRKMSNPLSISSITVSLDHKILFGKRSSKVVSEPEKIQTLPGGYVHPPDTLLNTVEKELYEELLIRRYEIADITVNGLALIHPSGKPEILVVVHLNIPSSIVRRRHGVDEWEFSQIQLFTESREGIIQFLSKNNETLTRASHASLVNYAIQNFGILSISHILVKI